MNNDTAVHAIQANTALDAIRIQAIQEWFRSADRESGEVKGDGVKREIV